MFEPKDVAEYYNTTQNHYEKWWDLRNSYSLHYGIWNKQTKTFRDAVVNTNRVLLELAGIKESDRVLDAGCGVGGAAIFVHTNTKARVTGITLSEKQVAFASNLVKEKGIDHQVDFQVMNYTQTSFPDQSFDVIWACESISSANDKMMFIKEAARLLKKGGKLILSDCFITDEKQQDKKEWIRKWGETWAVENHISSQTFVNGLKKNDFEIKSNIDYTAAVTKSAKRMYVASLLGMIPSETYNFFHPKVSRFAKSHYKSGYYQYRALQENLWKYNVILAEKK